MVVLDNVKIYVRTFIDYVSEGKYFDINKYKVEIKLYRITVVLRTTISRSTQLNFLYYTYIYLLTYIHTYNSNNMLPFKINFSIKVCD